MTEYEKQIDEAVNRIGEIHAAIGNLIIMSGPAPQSNRVTVDSEQLGRDLAFVKAFVNVRCRRLAKEITGAVND